ncbi:MAG: hypothetical protein E7174_01555 [Firmicutes bacterium]|nr:hypothetical protein [Bacillota bacterium]
MKLSIYKNVLKKLKNEKTRLISGALIITTLFTLTGCKSENKKDDTISINIVDEMYEAKNGEYEYVLNLEAIKVNPLNKFSLLKEVETESYNNYSINGKTDAFFNKYNYIILPSCYEHYNKGIENKAFYKFIYENSKRKLEIKKLKGLDGNIFTLITNSIEITRNIDPGYKMLIGGQKQLLKGDKLESKTLMYEGEIIAFKQTGVGSECDNVIQIGKLDKALIPVDSILNEDVNIKYNETEKILDTVKQKIIKK